MKKHTKNTNYWLKILIMIFTVMDIALIFPIISIMKRPNEIVTFDDEPETYVDENVMDQNRIELAPLSVQSHNISVTSIDEEIDGDVLTEVKAAIEIGIRAVMAVGVKAEEDLEVYKSEEIFCWDCTWTYADYSKIHSDNVTMYYSHTNRKNIVIALNAGHGTKGGSSVFTLCHPDGSLKVTGGSTAAGSLEAPANSEGTTFLDGTPEADGTLRLALIVKEDLLQAGYDVLMLRESDDAQIDNVARTVYANNLADCHISLHYDSSDNDKGFFYISVPNVESYRSMEPVASHWEEHNALGEALLSGMIKTNVKIFGSGSMEIDLTQTSYSTIPSVDIEVGDRASSRDESTLRLLSEGIISGLDEYFIHDKEYDSD